MLDGMLARANSVLLPSLSRSDRRTLASLHMRVEWAVLGCTGLCLQSK